VTAKYILAGLSVLFFILAMSRMARGSGAGHSQARTWLIIGVIFGVVSAWLFSQG
jgi:hypothetical protein